MYWGYMALFVLGTIQLHATTCYRRVQDKTVALETIVKYLKKDESVLNGLYIQDKDGNDTGESLDVRNAFGNSVYCQRF